MASYTISNKDALKDKIHEIHNYMRNNGVGYGMSALKVFNLLYGLKKIEEKNLIDIVKLKRPECEFSYLLGLANQHKESQLTSLFLNDVLDSIAKSSIRDLIFYELPRNIKSGVLMHLLKEIDKITLIENSCNVLLSGKIYEYFVGRDKTAISELGAYFTDKHIVEFIYNNKLKPELNNDGTVPTMIDMFGGSGGFTTEYINYLNTNNKNINWETELNKVYHFDVNENVIKSAGLEFLCSTGVLPNIYNVKQTNSFTDDYQNDKNESLKFKYIITNPPYGGDKLTNSYAQIKRNKIKEYIKNELKTMTDENKKIKRQQQLKMIKQQEEIDNAEFEKIKVSVNTSNRTIKSFAEKYELSGNDKESCSLMLIMALLDTNGTACCVLKDGVFFNKVYKDLRRCLVQNYNVREVISVPQDQFENTLTKTSIIIFDNTDEKTSKVKFSELIVDKYTNDKFEKVNTMIHLIENKGDISNVHDRLVFVASVDEILKNNICSLNGKDYNKNELIVGK